MKGTPFPSAILKEVSFSRKVFHKQHFSLLTIMELMSLGAEGWATYLPARSHLAMQGFYLCCHPERVCCSGACDSGSCFLNTSVRSSWDLASSMSQIKKLTPKLQIHLRYWHFEGQFSQAWTMAVVNNQAPRNRPLNQNLGLWPPLWPDTHTF